MPSPPMRPWSFLPRPLGSIHPLADRGIGRQLCGGRGKGRGTAMFGVDEVNMGQAEDSEGGMRAAWC